MYREHDAATIYRDAKPFNITGEGYVWIVTEQALLPPSTPIGFFASVRFTLRLTFIDTYGVFHVKDDCNVLLLNNIIIIIEVRSIPADVTRRFRLSRHAAALQRRIQPESTHRRRRPCRRPGVPAAARR